MQIKPTDTLINILKEYPFYVNFTIALMVKFLTNRL